MWRCISMAALAVAFLAAAAAAGYAQDSMSPYSGKTAPGKSRSDQTGTGGTARGDNGALGAGDAAKGDWSRCCMLTRRYRAVRRSGQGLLSRNTLFPPASYPGTSTSRISCT